MDRIVTSFSGFLDCLENPVVRGTVFCGGVWHAGEIKGNAALQKAYEMGKTSNKQSASLWNWKLFFSM